jgi:hypothetical protein
MPLLALLFDYLPPLSVKNDETCATSQECQRKRDFERNSYIVLVIGGVVLVSALLMTIQYVFMIVDEPDGDVGLCDGLQF